MLAEAVDRARTTAEAKHVRLDIGGVRGTRVLGQHELLVTAVRNLAGQRGRVLGRGRARRRRRPARRRDLVEIAVVDEGIGISAAEQERVFERFYRVDPARSRDTGGTGLGLSIVKHVAADHGGDVTVWSQPGRGSTFTLRLPRAEDAPERAAPPGPVAADTIPDQPASPEGAHVRRSAS